MLENAVIEIPRKLFRRSVCLVNLTIYSMLLLEIYQLFERLYDEKLSAIPIVQRLISTIVMKDVVPERLYFRLAKSSDVKKSLKLLFNW